MIRTLKTKQIDEYDGRVELRKEVYPDKSVIHDVMIETSVAFVVIEAISEEGAAAIYEAIAINAALVH